ncbi:MAG: group 1 truncated hemoglobin [Pseudomonadales bacterium]|nr:group 1 truncated hemoglobin [Pseudomonadales bacterium]
MTQSLYERLGGPDNVQRIANSLVDNHINNPVIGTRFAQMDADAAKVSVAQFLSTGTGGPTDYTGEDMVTTHKGMNISAIEFIAVLDDALDALSENGVGEREQQEMLFILYSMRSEIIAV